MKNVLFISAAFAAFSLPATSFAKDSITNTILGKSADVHRCKGDRVQNEAGGPWVDMPYGWVCDGGVMAPDPSAVHSETKNAARRALDGTTPIEDKAVEAKN